MNGVNQSSGQIIPCQNQNLGPGYYPFLSPYTRIGPQEPDTIPSLHWDWVSEAQPCPLPSPCARFGLQGPVADSFLHDWSQSTKIGSQKVDATPSPPPQKHTFWDWDLGPGTASATLCAGIKCQIQHAGSRAPHQSGNLAAEKHC